MKHIAVCVCTYKRPDYLKRLLRELAGQETGGLFTYSIVVADNDQSESARAVVSHFASSSPIQIQGLCPIWRCRCARTRETSLRQ